MRKQYHVVPRNGGWAVKGANARRVSACRGTKSLAVKTARSLARGQKPSQVVIHGKNGAIQREWTYGSDPFPPRG